MNNSKNREFDAKPFREELEELDPEFHIKSFVKDGVINTKPHWHNEVEIIYVLEGNAVQQVNDSVFNIRKGDIVIINSLYIHSVFSNICENTKSIVMQFHPEFLNEAIEDILVVNDKSYEICGISNMDKVSSMIGELIEELYQELQLKRKDYKFVTKSLLYRILTLIIRDCKEYIYSRKHAAGIKDKLNMLRGLFEYISENYTEKISISQVAKLCNMNEQYFCRFFKRYVGKTFIEFLNEIRVEEARRLLTLSSMNVVEIAEKVGFMNVNYFNKVFKHYTKCCPTGYKKTLYRIKENEGKD